jgi:ribose 5-phosphate isomerase A
LNPKRDQTEEAKRLAASEAVKHVKDGLVIGLGSGSTAAYAIAELGDRMKHEELDVLAVPTSYQAFMLAVEQKIPVTTLEEHPTIDLTIDGADQIDRHLNLIKGMGGALTREKIVASASKRFIIIADKSKTVEVLGESNHPIPLEVIPFAARTIMLRIKKMEGIPVLRQGKGKVGPVITDNGNVVVDAYFGLIHAPAKLENRLRMPGLVETGLFVKMADLAYIGTGSGVERRER